MLKRLADIKGPLVETYLSLNPETIQQADEITSQRRRNPRMQNHSYNTANVMLYQKNEDGSLTYKFGGRRPFNIVLGANVEEVQQQLVAKSNYRLTSQQLQAIDDLDAEDILEMNPLELQLNKAVVSNQGADFCHFEIGTVRLNQTLNNVQRAFAERVYGEGRAFDRAMEMIRGYQVDKEKYPILHRFLPAERGATTAITFLNPEYVRKYLNEGETIARLCVLSDFFLSYSSFSAVVYDVEDPLGGCVFRGVPIKSKKSLKTSLRYSWFLS